MERPMWVQLGLWGLKSRGSVLAFMWLCILIAGVLAFFRVWYGLILLIAAVWYWLALRWVGKHEGW